MRRSPKPARQPRKTGSDSRHHSKWHAGSRQDQHFFAAAPKNKRIPAFEPEDSKSAMRVIDHLNADRILRDRGGAGAFTDEMQLRAGSCQRQHSGIDQGIVNNDVGLQQRGERIERQQSGVARSGANQPDLARCKQRAAPTQRRERLQGSVLVAL